MKRTAECRIAECPLCERRTDYRAKDDTIRLHTPSQVFGVVQTIAKEPVENLLVLALSGVNGLLARNLIARGAANCCHVGMVDVFSPAMRVQAVSIILIHNHPSGSLEPSFQDIAITRRVMMFGRALGIDLLDHAIVARTGFTSLRTNQPDMWRDLDAMSRDEVDTQALAVAGVAAVKK